MSTNKLLLLVAVTAFAPALQAQHSVGLLSYNPAKSLDGYNMIYPHNQPNVYLLDNCGEIVHVWTDAASARPGNTAYLMPDGRLVKTKRPAAVANNPIWTGGGGATVEIRDWDNNLEWSYTLNDSLHRLHHDITVTDKNTILMITWELKTPDQAIAAGRNPATLPQGKLWPDYIIEVDVATKKIIWEWHVWDHLIQDFDPTKANYGVVKDHPELVDVNYVTNNGEPSWLHSNAIDYWPLNDQILLSSPTFSEVWIIDHSTTTAQAAGHAGGLGGHGGDLMYRWGNPAAYQAGTAADQKLFFQHDPHWVFDFIDPFDPHYGKIEAFNNRAGADYSTANAFNPGFDMYKWEYPKGSNGLWGPAGFETTIKHPVPTKMYSTGLSSVQYLPNGNYLICSGQYGYAFELTPANELVWEYVVPLKNGAAAPQGTVLAQNDNQTFRMKRYPATYSAFAGRDLSPKGWIETMPDSIFCAKILPVKEQNPVRLQLFPNPAGTSATLRWAAGENITLEVSDLLGRQILAPQRFSGGQAQLDTSGWPEGVYVVRVQGAEPLRLVVRR